MSIRDSVSTVAVPAGAELGLSGLSPVITPNADFYRIDTALVVPQVDPSTWQLRIHGLFSYTQLTLPPNCLVYSSDCHAASTN